MSLTINERLKMDNQKKPNGVQLLVEQLSYEFEIEENINYYSFKNFLRAKRKYIKFMITSGCVPNPKSLICN